MLSLDFRCETYSANIIFYCDCSPLQIKKHMAKKYCIDNVDCENADVGFTNNYLPEEDNASIRYVVWIRHNDDIATLVHECIHLAFRILEDRGIKVNIENDEVLAYYHSYLFKTLWNEMVIYSEKKLNRKKVKKDA